MDEEESLNKKLLNIKNSISEIKQEINTFIKPKVMPIQSKWENLSPKQVLEEVKTSYRNELYQSGKFEDYQNYYNSTSTFYSPKSINNSKYIFSNAHYSNDLNNQSIHSLISSSELTLSKSRTASRDQFYPSSQSLDFKDNTYFRDNTKEKENNYNEFNNKTNASMKIISNPGIFINTNNSGTCDRFVNSLNYNYASRVNNKDNTIDNTEDINVNPTTYSNNNVNRNDNRSKKNTNVSNTIIPNTKKNNYQNRTKIDLKELTLNFDYFNKSNTGNVGNTRNNETNNKFNISQEQCFDHYNNNINQEENNYCNSHEEIQDHNPNKSIKGVNLIQINNNDNNNNEYKSNMSTKTKHIRSLTPTLNPSPNFYNDNYAPYSHRELGEAYYRENKSITNDSKNKTTNLEDKVIKLNSIIYVMRQENNALKQILDDNNINYSNIINKQEEGTVNTIFSEFESIVNEMKRLLNNLDNHNDIIPKFKEYLDKFKSNKIRDEFLNKLYNIYSKVSKGVIKENTKKDINVDKLDKEAAKNETNKVVNISNSSIKDMWYWLKNVLRNKEIAKFNNELLNSSDNNNITNIKTEVKCNYKLFCDTMMEKYGIKRLNEFFFITHQTLDKNYLICKLENLDTCLI